MDSANDRIARGNTTKGNLSVLNNDRVVNASAVLIQ
jgi:hypothetical protein